MTPPTFRHSERSLRSEESLCSFRHPGHTPASTQTCHPERSEGSRFSFCHPDRSGPIFSYAPSCGASGRAVEGSQRDHADPPPSPHKNCHPERSEGSAFRFLSNPRVLSLSSFFDFRFSPPVSRSLASDHLPSRSHRATIYRNTTYSPNLARQWYYSSRWVEHGRSNSPGGLA
jgi:hypothetical protein